MASIDKETEEYYNKYFDLFTNDGWKQLIEELRQNALAINSVEATKDSDDLYIRKGTIVLDNDLSENIFQSSGYNNHSLWLFWNDTGTLETSTTGISPFNYYPHLKDISNIEFKTNQGTSSTETRNWKIEILKCLMN